MLSTCCCELKDVWLSSCAACLSLHTYRAADPGSRRAMGREAVNLLCLMKVYKLGRMTVKEVDPVAALPLPQQLVQKSVLKGDGAFVLLESPYGLSLLRNKLGKRELCKWEKWPSLPGAQTWLVSCNLRCALEKNPQVLIACKGSKRELQLEH